MRLKIIAVFSLIVLLLGGLMLVVSIYTSAAPVDAAEAPRALQAAVVQLELDGMATERWLSTQAKDAAVREPFGISDKLGDARARKATEVCDALRGKAAKVPELSNVASDFIALVDAKGVVLGRDQLTAMRNEDLGKVYPSLKAALDAKAPMSDVWLEKTLNHQHLVSFAPVVGDDGKLLGGIIYASLLNDARLNATSAKTSAKPLLVLSKAGNGVEVIAKSEQADATMAGTLGKGPAADAISKNAGDAMDVPGFGATAAAKARGLEGYGDDGNKVAVVAVVTAPPTNIGKIAVPVLVLTGLGILLVVLAGYMLDAYIMRPIAEIEEGLLGIMNGQTNRRFEIEHAELGGVVFRLNSLLNQLFQVTEDDTDSEGRPSTAPSGKGFKEAIAVDESMAESGTSPADAASLRNEPEGTYYGRLFDEYIAAKRSAGDPTDHITRDEFIERIRTSEREMAAKHGKPVRYKVESKENKVILIAIPLA